MRLSTGRTGKSFNDRELAGRVRTLALEHIWTILQKEYKDKEFQKEVILKLTPNLLPKLSEHTGKDGKDLPQPLLFALNPTNVSDHDSDEEDSGTDETN